MSEPQVMSEPLIDQLDLSTLVQKDRQERAEKCRNEILNICKKYDISLVPMAIIKGNQIIMDISFEPVSK